MRKFPVLLDYAAAIAPVIDAAHVNAHAAAHRAGLELAERAGVTIGLLNDLRFILPLRALTRRDLSALYRYRDAAGIEAGLREHLREGTLAEDGAGTLRLTRTGLSFVLALYEVQGAGAERVWADHEPKRVLDLVTRVLDRAEPLPGGAFELAVPPYEPDGAPAELLLFNRLAALRYHRADAHAAAWQIAGLSAAEIVTLPEGPLRTRIEDDTNRRAAQPYLALSPEEREALRDGLFALV
ncbi:hypothetical protein HII36_07160 [Nonomuraea sp. NN258]|uniref:hypothetical protein n=1 Tax=Nonomuraea antri TaxID=2730852 RepID=UPI0015686383|nr:hypothetical protein [Nonomuraea antri]NRQ31619.1 hypothetical protein [Nonomuraea antri]